MLLLTLAVAPAFAGKRVALVIGNSDYRDKGIDLVNPKNDAADVGAALQKLGFEVEVAPDLDRHGFIDKLTWLQAKATDAEIALFYYAGHAVQLDHVNYFIPVDAAVDKAEYLKSDAISADQVQAALADAQGVQVMILDACRDNPFAALKVATRGLAVSRGLERIQIRSKDSVVLYSTRINDVAADGDGTRNSPFSSVLVQQLLQPQHRELGTLLREVASKVKAATKGRQAPELSLSLSGDYFLDAGNDRTAWEAIKDTLDPAVLRQFIADYPDSALRPWAERRVATFEQQAEERKRQQDEQDRQALLCSMSRQLLDAYVAGRDQAGLERLGRDNSCPALGGTIDRARQTIASADQATACARKDEDLQRMLQAGEASGLADLAKGATACPGLAQRVDEARASLQAAAERRRLAADRDRLCRAEGDRLAALRAAPGADQAAVATLAATASCDTVRTAALQFGRDLQAAAAARKAACDVEAGTLRQLERDGPRSAIEALGRAHQCETLDIAASLATFDRAAAQRLQQASCAALDIGQARDGGDIATLRDVARRCPSREPETLAAVAAIEARQHMAEVCRLEGAELQGYVAAGQAASVTALRDRAACKDLDFQAAGRQIAEKVCQEAVAAVTSTADDEAALRAAATRIDACAPARTRATERLAALQRADQSCDRQVASAAARGDDGALAHLADDPLCVRRRDGVQAKVQALLATRAQQARETCDAGLRSLEGKGGSDEATLRRLSTDPLGCDRLRTAADDKLKTLLTAQSRDDAACDQSVATAAADGDAKAVAQLGKTALCVRRQGIVATAATQAKEIYRQRVEQAQVRLAALGCAVGTPNGVMDASTIKALKTYGAAKGLSGTALTTISRSLAAELDAQQGIVCVPSVAAVPPAPAPKPVAKLEPGSVGHGKDVAPRRETRRAAPEAQERPRRQKILAQPQYEPRPPRIREPRPVAAPREYAAPSAAPPTIDARGTF